MAGYAFLCHSHADRVFASKIKDQLRRSGIDVWSADSPLGNWLATVTNKIDGCSAFIVVMSPAAAESRWVNLELNRARDLGKPIFPMLREGEGFVGLSLEHMDDVRAAYQSASPGFIERIRHAVTQPANTRLPHAGRPGLEDSQATRMFISYRRTDSGFAAHWLHRTVGDWLERHTTLRRECVFIDVDSIDPGSDFEVAIETAIAKCRVVLVVIGDRWLSERLIRPDDYVRREIEIALRHPVSIVPVLLTPANMPDAQALPNSIRSLVRRNAVTLEPKGFTPQVSNLCGQLVEILALAPEQRR